MLQAIAANIALCLISLILFISPCRANETVTDVSTIEIQNVGTLKLFRDIHSDLPHADIAWLDNENVLLVEKHKKFIFFDNYRLVSLNISSLNKSEVLSKAESNFCFDPESKNLVLRSYEDGYFGGFTTRRYGRLGEELKSFEGRKLHPWQSSDCLVQDRKNFRRNYDLRDGNDLIPKDQADETLEAQHFILKRADGTEKAIDLGEKGKPYFFYNPFLKGYVRTLDDRNHLELLQYDLELNLVKTTKYFVPPELTNARSARVPTKSGLLLIRNSSVQEKSSIHLVKEHGMTAKVLGGFHKARAVASPDGCHVFLHLTFRPQSPQFGILTVCN